MNNEFYKPEMILCQIESIRISENIPMHRMTYGLCDRSLPGKVLNGQNRKLDKLLIDAFYQRLGRNLRNFEALLDADEYTYYEAREAFRDAFSKNDIEEAKTAAKKYASMDICSRSHLHRQMSEMFDVSLMIKEKEDPECILKKAKDALELTVPGFTLEKLKEYYYTETELILLDIILKASRKLFGDAYVYPFYDDVCELYGAARYAQNEQVHRFAPMIYAAALLKLKRGDLSEAAALSDRMVRNLVNDNKIRYLAEFLEIKSKAEGGTVDERFACVIKEAVMKYHPEWSPDEDIQIYWEYMIIPVGKIVKQRRQMLGLSQEDLTNYNGETICSIDTVYRLERGRHTINWEVEKKILSKLRLMPERFHREFMTDDYDDIKVLKEVINAQATGDLEKIKKGIEELDRRHQETYLPHNEQYISFLKQKMMGIPGNNGADSVNEYKRTLSVTMPGNPKENGELDDCYPFNTESMILMLIASELFKKGEKEKGFVLCKNLLDNYEKLGNYSNTFYNCVTNIERLVASELGNVSRFEESDRIAKESLIKCFRHNKLDQWSSNIYCLAWNNGADPGKKKDKQTELRASYVLSKLQKKKRGEQCAVNQCNLYYSGGILDDLM